MKDIWILAFVYLGQIHAAGDTMPLEECEWRAKDTGNHTAMCINVTRPTCRIYPRNGNIQSEMQKRCRERLEK